MKSSSQEVVLELKIFALELKNFRQYKGLKRIEFSTDDKKNFTVVQGANGTGKTNLLNAITWCLYGDEKHLSKISSHGMISGITQMVNNRTVEECEDNKFVEIKVRMILGDNKPTYQIQRTKMGIKDSDGTITFDNTDNFQVLWLSNDRDWKPVTSQPNYFINLLLPEGIHDFFFFDGEKLDDFFKTGSSKRIHDSIKSVAQIDILDKAMEHLDRMQDDIRRSSKGLDSNVDEKNARIDILKAELKKKKETLERLESQDTQLESNIKEIDEKMRTSSVPNVKLLQKNRDQLERDIEALDRRRTALEKQAISHLVDSAPYVYAREAILFSSKLIKDRYKRGDLPPKVRQTYIKELLESGQCICGTPLLNGSPEREKVKRLARLAQLSSIEDAITSGKFKLEEILRDMNQFLTSRDFYGRELESLEREINDKQEALKDISSQLGTTEVEEIAKLESNRKILDDERKNLNQEIGSLNSDITKTDAWLEQLQSEQEKVLAKNKRYSNLMKQLHLCREAYKVVETIKGQILNQIRKIIELKTKEYFISLIWKKETFVDLKIDSNFNVSLFHRGGWDALGLLSAGERQVLALSFMAALREAARVDAPVVIDTPLGRISGEPKENIAGLLPKYLKNTQVILFVTDQEYTQAVRTRLLERIGKEHRLEYNEKLEETIIVPIGKR